MPIDRAVDLNAARFAGSNPAASHARGVETLTIRPLLRHLPPDEEWVLVGYVGTDGQARELRQPWLVVDDLPAFAGPGDAADAFLGLDLELDQTSRAKTLLFAPQVVGQIQADQPPVLTTSPAAAGQEVPTGRGCSGPATWPRLLVTSATSGSSRSICGPLASPRMSL
jgi:hypothetical protein